jgi:glucose/arabinose dehydrogenase
MDRRRLHVPAQAREPLLLLGGLVVVLGGLAYLHRHEEAVPTGRTTSRSAAPGWRIRPAYPRCGFQDPVVQAAAARADRLFVAERGGKIWSLPLRDEDGEKALVADWSERGASLWGLAPHPDFGDPASPHRDDLFVGYQTAASLRVSRISASGPASAERVVFERPAAALFPPEGSLLFHPRERFLYAAIPGDPPGTSAARPFEGGILRLRVDPDPGTTRPYAIPPDNPWRDPGTGRAEFFALGVRRPSALAYDPFRDRVWFRDGGERLWQEINILENGAHYGWPFREGTTTLEDPSSSLPLGVERSPVHQASWSAENPLTGGIFVDDASAGALHGCFVFAERSGSVWAMDYDGVRASAPRRVTATEGVRLAGVGTDGAGGIYLLPEGKDARLLKLVPPDAEAPRLLSAEGVFRDVRAREPAPGWIPYDVSVPHWADGARSRRWVHLARGRIRAPADALWTFPPGTRVAQQFDDPVTGRGMETRLLAVGTDGGISFRSYRWREDQSEADAVPRADASGSRHECAACHRPEAGGILGLNARNLVAGPLADLLDTPPDSPIRPATVSGGPLEKRVRAYLDVHCAPCHRPGGVRSFFDARADAPEWERRLLGAPPAEGLPLLAPGMPEKSLLLLRLSLERPHRARVPAYGVGKDVAAAELLAEWIRGVPDRPGAAASDVEPGRGLNGRYFKGIGFDREPVLERIDPSIDFDWGHGSPDAKIPPDRFSARWTGEIEPEATELCTFTLETDDGARLWIDGRLVLDRWSDQGPSPWTADVPLVEGRRCRVDLEMYEREGGASARLFWASARRPKTIVPQKRLYPR